MWEETEQGGRKSSLPVPVLITISSVLKQPQQVLVLPSSGKNGRGLAVHICFCDGSTLHT